MEKCKYRKYKEMTTKRRYRRGEKETKIFVDPIKTFLC